jgi:hypothetical protein
MIIRAAAVKGSNAFAILVILFNDLLLFIRGSAFFYLVGPF